MGKWQRINYQPVLPLGRDHTRITGSKEHIALSKSAATEGMVLLKNQNNVLPLQRGTRVALFGKATIDYVKGGGGSGDVYTEYVHNLADGMAVKETEGKVSIYPDLNDYYRDYVASRLEAGYLPGMMREPKVPENLLQQAAAFADTAIISLSRYSGEGWDRRTGQKDDIRYEYTSWDSEIKQREVYEEVFGSNDFYLTTEEQELFQDVQTHFKHVIVVLNVGSVVDTNWTLDEKIDAVLISWQGGMEGGLATAELLCGDETPSGHLTDTFARSLSDYPSAKGFHDSADYVIYSDDIYVGYRYFYTIPGAAEKVNYPFGYGLSYTTFECRMVETEQKEDAITFSVQVTNTGSRSGKEVVQLYYSAPQGKLQKPARELIRFAKTALLEPGQSELLTLQLDAKEMKSYDDLGLISPASWIMEKGTYHFFVGDNVRDAVKSDFTYELKEDVILEKTGHKAAPNRRFQRLLADGTTEWVGQDTEQKDTCGLTRQNPYELEGRLPGQKGTERVYYADNHGGTSQFLSVWEGKMSLDDFLSSLSLEEKVDLLGGQISVGVANTNGIGNNRKRGIPNVMTADGPAGLRFLPETGVTTTAWPIATSLACTWNEGLMEQIGRETALEIKENNLGIWLAPACNIHRSPLCGRNFEYFSEDPYLTGKAGAAIVKGTQSEHIAATPKHFAANNKETNRKASDSVVSERALREIYLKQFEMIVKETDPYLIMASYNKINGTNASENTDLLTGILREEWGFEGVISTDWWSLTENYLEIKAGNDLKMACGYPERVMEAYEKGLISEEEIDRCAKRILELILKLE